MAAVVQEYWHTQMTDRDSLAVSIRRRLPDRATIVAVLAVVAVLGGYLWLVGVGGVLNALARISAAELLALAAAGAVPLVCWGLALRAVFAAIGIDASTPLSIAYFVGTVFLNGVTPFGQLGGDPPSGLLIAHTGPAAFEDGLAAIGSVNALNRVAVVALGAVAWVILGGRSATGDALLASVVLAVLAVAVVGALVVLAWRDRDRVTTLTVRLLAPPAVALGARLPVGPTPTRAAVADRVEGFVAAVGRLGAARGLLGLTLLLGLLGHLATAGLLWLAIAAVGVPAPLVAVIAVLPLAKLSGLAPLPGGTGTAPVLLGGLLVTVVGVAGPTAAAAALLYRAVAFWSPTVAGGVVTAALLSVRG